MALVVADRVKETTITSGTGTYSLDGAIVGFQSFGNAIGNSNTTYYTCTDGSNYEIGIGTYASSGSTLARTTILKSTNSNNAVDWGSVTKDIFVTYPADKAVYKDASGNISGVAIGSDVQAYDADLTALGGLAKTDSNFIVGSGSTWVAETGATVRTSLGLGTAAVLATGISDTNVPKFTSGVADDDFLRVDGTAIEGRSASEVLSDIGGQASLTFGISNTNAVKVDSASVADDEYARFTANGLESRSTSEVLSDIGGQASLTFGISNTNAVKIDSASVADDEYARFTADGLESRSTSEVLSDIGGQASLTFGKSDTNALKLEEAVTTNDILLAGSSHVKGRTYAELKSDLSLNNVENTALSSWVGTSNITTLGTIGTGTWQGTAVADSYISSASTWNAKQAALTFGIADTNAVKIDSASVADDEYARFTANGLESRSTSEVLSDIGGQAALTFGKSDTNALKLEENVLTNDILHMGTNHVKGRTYSEFKTAAALNNVENTAISTFAGSSNITTIGTLAQNVNLIFEGATANDFETTLTVTDPTADRTVKLPNATGTLGELLITSGSVSDVASIAFDNTIMTTDFIGYRIEIFNVQAVTDVVVAYARLGYNNTAETSAYYRYTSYWSGGYANDSTYNSGYSTDNSDTQFQLNNNTYGKLSNVASEHGHFNFVLPNASSSSSRKMMSAEGSMIYTFYPMWQQCQYWVGVQTASVMKDNPINYFDFLLSSGNIASADYRVYGRV